MSFLSSLENDISNLPDDAARATGDGVGAVEGIPQDLRNDYDGAKQDVEGIPCDVDRGVDDAANDVGDAVGDVQRFDQGIDNSYDQGRNEGRYGN
ncbi:hypothetical protein NEOLEDRAFT_1243172 [Neolentinus lepideus HHB14362 ss-1]|uniref:Uncharacterized protein n=1 Tax=Neolentinus lepideus HHB14362 ss-1 TaxID=1314782 RepID=A0A165RC12_9AGAM|nr:hypothetical protein NEOLEDRAFT_1243172 [Neolentinus lepideus HHB14362 ss-1]